MHLCVICSLDVAGKENSMCFEVFGFWTISAKIYTWKAKYHKANTALWSWFRLFRHSRWEKPETVAITWFFTSYICLGFPHRFLHFCSGLFKYYWLCNWIWPHIFNSFKIIYFFPYYELFYTEECGNSGPGNQATYSLGYWLTLPGITSVFMVCCCASHCHLIRTTNQNEQLVVVKFSQVILSWWTYKLKGLTFSEKCNTTFFLYAMVYQINHIFSLPLTQ